MFLIAIIFLLLGFIFCMWVVSRILGRIGYATHGEKGRKIGRKAPWMLVLVFIAYNIVEYFYVRFQVQYLCKKEAGVFVYVTPEQWKEENKDELDQIVIYDYEEGRKLAKNMDNIIIDNVVMRPWVTENSRITSFQGLKDKSPNQYSGTFYDLLLDTKTGKVLMKSFYISTGVGSIWVNGDSLKEWMNTVPSCSEVGHEFLTKKRTYLNFVQ